MDNINGGAVLWARQTIESDIFFWKPPEWFKIWFYIVSKVNHKNGKQFKRGEGYFNWAEDKLKLKNISSNQWHKCVKWLKQENQILVRKTTRGNIIFIVNYNKFQTLMNYKSEAGAKHIVNRASKMGEAESEALYHDKSTVESEAESKAGAKHKLQDIQECKECKECSPFEKDSNNMNLEELNDGDIHYEEGDGENSARPITFGKYPAKLAKFYCELVGKREASAQLKAGKAIMKVAQEDTPGDTLEKSFEEAKERIKIADWYYKHNNISEWNLIKVAENWDKIDSWYEEKKKYN